MIQALKSELSNNKAPGSSITAEEGTKTTHGNTYTKVTAARLKGGRKMPYTTTPNNPRNGRAKEAGTKIVQRREPSADLLSHELDRQFGNDNADH